MKMDYCEVCGKEVGTKIVSRKETFRVCGEPIEIEAEVMVCAECGEALFNEELDSASLISAYNEYRRRHKLLLPEEIRGIREQYGLSQRSFARLLGWGDKTIRRYENGTIQDRAHNSLLLFLRQPANMRAYLTDNETGLDEKQKTGLLKRVEQMERETASPERRRLLEAFFSSAPSEENGFKGFDYEKFCAMVLFFAHKEPALPKTKLMKLLTYADMVCYKVSGTSMSGLRYCRLPYGPVPEHFDMLLGKMAADGIAHVDVVYEGANEKHQVVPECGLPEGSLSEAELEILERIHEKFRELSSSEFSKYAHREKAYRSAKKGDIISYASARDIRLN